MHSTSTDSTARTRLRDAVTGVESMLDNLMLELDEEGPGSRKVMAELRTRWAALVQLLALGPGPEVCPCPVCQHSVRRDAKLCGYCWAALEPLARHTATSPAKPAG